MHIALNFILSANAPTTKAGVMIANVIWNTINKLSGIVPDAESRVRFDKKKASVPPIKEPLPVKAKLYP